MQNHKNELQRSMKSRHLFMIALGGVIGTGLFLGSGFTISQAGLLGAIAAYIIGGFLMYLVMLCLRIGCCHAGGRIVSGLRH
ncbi:Amino-acid permease RocC [Bacillus subtilis subsp. subtilis]|nr:Amino-acid permease RocC [Bacillus subtilis subsp. subtilis]